MADRTELSTNELLWVASKSLLTAANRCNDTAEGVALARYRTDGSGPDTAEMQRQLELAIEELELALSSIETLDDDGTDGG